MPIYSAPNRDLGFILHDVLRVHERDDLDGLTDLTPDMTSAILEEAGKLATETFLPLNMVGDQGCHYDNGVVRTPEGFKDAFNLLREGGWTGLECAEEYGGQNLPSVLNICVGEIHSAANMAFMMYHGLTHGAYSAIKAHGTDAQKDLYLPRLTSGEWTGTMNLTEPHCGTDLGLLKTKAEPQDDGSYKITGQKIFISAGEHDLADNIIHLVLAKIPGGPEGVKGISLFVVPKFLPNEDGSLGARNAVAAGKIEEKMGIHGNSTCVMNYDGATGWLVGEAHKGLRAMFTMMNEARLLVGMQGLAQAEIAYQNAVAYAKDRLQGRAVTGAKEPEKAADPIIVHPDVRRMLMDLKAWTEGMRCFQVSSALLVDAQKRAGDEAARQAAEDRLGLLTPVLKGVLTDRGFDLTVEAQQVFGGHGYIAEWGMEQYVRDARIAQIYEGANGIQALDLVGRKLAMKGGQTLMAWFGDIMATLKAHKENTAIAADFVEPLKAASKELQAAAEYFMAEGMKNPDNALAGANDFMHLFGLVAVGEAWLRMAAASAKALEEGAGDKAFHENKLATGRYYMQRILPESAVRLARIRSGGDVVMALDADAF